MKTKLSTVFLRILSLLLFLTLLCFPREALQGASTGLVLWFETVLPTLLPTMILTDFLLQTGADRYLTRLISRPFSILFGLSNDGCYAGVVGLLCGYPMGAKTAATLFKQGRISLWEAQYLLAFANQPSPMFIIGYLCLGLFADQDGNQLILPLILGIYVSSYMSSILYRIFHRSSHPFPCPLDGCIKISPTHNKSADSSPLSMLESSMMTSFEVMVKIGGYMMLFSIAESYIGILPLIHTSTKSLLMGIIEMTTGSRHIAACMELPWSLAFCGTVTAFGGICGYAQTANVLQDSGLSLKTYLVWKLLQGVFAGILIFLICAM